jgi:D-sedoheptulose 7-phosphate isomerase
MLPRDRIEQHFASVTEALAKISTGEVEAVAAAIVTAALDGRTVFVAGNGGSASTASHIAADLARAAMGCGRQLRIVSLCDNVALLTAISNDVDFDEVFERQLDTAGGADDVLLVVSGSGASRNILEAIECARRRQMKPVGLVGFEGGEAVRRLDSCVVVPAVDYGVIEDVHLAVGHALAAVLQSTLAEPLGPHVATSASSPSLAAVSPRFR